MYEMIYRTVLVNEEPPVTRALARKLSSAQWFDISAARKDFGYAPEISFEDGLRLLREDAARSDRCRAVAGILREQWVRAR
jgi:2-alkyl-3-oxoalkanoate reductase